MMTGLTSILKGIAALSEVLDALEHEGDAVPLDVARIVTEHKKELRVLLETALSAIIER